LAARGVTGVYTATAARVAVVSVTAGVTAWTNGHQIWCTFAGQHYTWPVADIEAAATALAELTRPSLVDEETPGSRTRSSSSTSSSPVGPTAEYRSFAVPPPGRRFLA